MKLTDKREFPAKVIGTDKTTDVAVLKKENTVSARVRTRLRAVPADITPPAPLKGHGPGRRPS